MAALIGNAFRLKQDRGSFTFLFDRSHANLIPMLKSLQNFKLLEELCSRYFEKKCDLNFVVGADPAIRQRKELAQKALAQAKANPKVQFILEQFNGTIVKCEPLTQSKQKSPEV